jgi:hypothetical protein
MGVFYDLGRPVVGGWMGGGWLLHDPVRKLDLLWGGEFGQEGAVLFAIDVDSGQTVEEFRVGCREFSATPDPQTNTLWICTYHGLYQPGHLLLSWNPRDRNLVSHGFPPLVDQRFCGSPLVAPDGTIYLGTHPHGHLVQYDPLRDRWKDCGQQALPPIVPDQHIWCYPRQVLDSGEVVCNIARDPVSNVAYDPQTNQRRALTDLPEAPEVTPPTRAVRAQFRFDARYEVDGQLRTSDYQPKVATDVVGLNPGPDGKMYGSTIISMHIFSFDPASRALEDLGRVGWGGGEIYDVIAHRDRLYMGSYSGGYWGVYDPERPWNPLPDSEGRDREANPHSFGLIGDDMNRPFEYAVGPDQRIYIACRANYRLPGGGLARFCPDSESIHVFRDLEQSVQCVAADERYVYGGTSISGGRGCIEETTQGRFFLFDVEREERAFECIPDSQAVAVTSLAVSHRSRLIYGSTSASTLFAFDLDQRQIVQRWRAPGPGTPLMGVPETYGVIHLTCGHDGDIYGVTQSQVFKIDVVAERIVHLDTPPIPDLYQIVEGAPGVFYMGARGHLLEYHLRDQPHYR